MSDHLICTLCEKKVSKRRATVLQQPAVIMCPPCFEDGIENPYKFYKVSEEFSIPVDGVLQ